MSMRDGTSGPFGSSSTRDTIVIGCSAGGVEALPRLLHQLQPDIPAAIAIVQHLAPTPTPYLVDILRRSTSLPVGWAEQGEAIQRGHVYVAPPDVHLLFTEGHARLAKGARENHSRPSIDKLFRSAAASRGNRVVGVLLTGMLDDGVAGLRAIREVGGYVIVQDPEDAQYPDLPTRALQAIEPDRVLSLDRMAIVLHEVVGSEAPATPLSVNVALEARVDQHQVAEPHELEALGPQTSISCPVCRGPTWSVGDPNVRRLRCYLGHVATARSMLDDTERQVETALWSAVRALHDRATTLESLASDAERLGNSLVSESYASRAKETRDQAELARKFLFDLMKEVTQ